MMKKKILLLFALLQFAHIINIQAETHRGYCGADGSKITYRLDTETGLLEISGSGEMKDYESIETGEGDEDYIFNSPWFNHRDDVRKIVISDGITHIGAGAFADCKSVTVITLPNSITSIGGVAFLGCHSISSMNLPDGVTSIGVLCFGRCSSLTSINIPIGVTQIRMLTFADCSSLESVTIPNSVSYISFYAFRNCDKIKDISCNGQNVVDADSDAFTATVKENATLHVPSALFDDYKNTEPWSGFRNIVKNETSINMVPTDGKRDIRIFSADGKERHSLGKGLNILLQADGEVIKVAR